MNKITARILLEFAQRFLLKFILFFVVIILERRAGYSGKAAAFEFSLFSALLCSLIGLLRNERFNRSTLGYFDEGIIWMMLSALALSIA